MSNSTGAGTMWNSEQFLGDLFLTGEKTPLLDAVGGIGGNRTVPARSHRYSCNVTVSLNAGSQPQHAESTLATTLPTPIVWDPSQEYNYTQPFAYGVTLSHDSLIEQEFLDAGGIQQLGLGELTKPALPEDKLAYQIELNLKQMAKDYNYTMINGAKNAATQASEYWKMGGILEAIATNAVDAGSNALTTADLDALALLMATNTAPLTDPMIFVGPTIRQDINDLYAVEPMDRKLGGHDLDAIMVPLLGRVPIVTDDDVPDTTVLIADIAYIRPVVNVVPKWGTVYYKPTEGVAAEAGLLNGYLGMAWGKETFHGEIYGIA